MDRPYVVLGVSSSLDGRISLGPNRTLMDIDERDDVLGNRDEWEEFYSSLQKKHDIDVFMEGSNMLVKETEELRELERYQGNEDELYHDFLPHEVVDRPGRTGWLAVVDGRGRVRGGYTGEEDKPMLHLVSRRVPPEYLHFLRKSNIPYLIAGEKRVDLALALEKMVDKLGAKAVLTSSGGRLSGALLKKGLLDEIHIRFNPVIIGGFDTPSLFASPDIEEGEWPTQLEFIEGEVTDTGHIFVRYRVKR